MLAVLGGQVALGVDLENWSANYAGHVRNHQGFREEPRRGGPYKTNNRHPDALRQASALSTSPGARAFYDAHRDAGAGHDKALRALANRLVGILHG